MVQVSIIDSRSEPVGTTTPVAWSGGEQFVIYMLREFEIDFQTSTYNILREPVFKGNAAEYISALRIENSDL